MSKANFFVPGPTCVRPEILAEMTRPMIAHRSSEFGDLFLRVVANLRPLFGTTGDTFVASGSGTALLEASLTNCVPRRVLVTTSGAFAERWLAIAESLGLEIDQLDAGWGNAVDPERLADHLASRRTQYDAVTLTHNETSTGLTNDVAALARVIREESPNTLILADAVSSLGGIEVRFDEWDSTCVSPACKRESRCRPASPFSPFRRARWRDARSGRTAARISTFSATKSTRTMATSLRRRRS